MIAIGLHNFPEGLAVGVGFGAEDPGRAVALAVMMFLDVTFG